MSREQKFAATYDTYFRHVYAYCRRRTELDRVDDAVADTFLTAWRRIEDMPDGERALPWLYGVAFRVVSHQWRSSNRKDKLDKKLVSIGAPVQEAADHLVVHREEISQLMDAASRLSEQDVEVLRLALWEELSTNDIGEVLGIPPNTAKQRYHRARNRLIKEFERVQAADVKSRPQKRGGAV